MKAVLAILLAGSAALFLYYRKGVLVREATGFLLQVAARPTGLDFKVGSVSGPLWGNIRFRGVRVEDPVMPEGQRLLFSAKEISFRYRLLDFLSKKFDSKVEVTVQSPELYWRARTHLRTERFPISGWLRRWALSQRQNLVIRVRDFRVYAGSAHTALLKDVKFSAEGDAFKVEIPLRHVEVGDLDISSVVKVGGHLQAGILNARDSLAGEITTEGTVVNWNPMPKEIRFEFVGSEQGFRILSSDFLGGVEATGEIDFEKGDEIRFSVRAEGYRLSNLDVFLGTAQKGSLPGRMDLELDFTGSFWAPNVAGHARIHDGGLGRQAFKAMDLHVTGVYPTVRLEDSRMMLEDGSIMRLGDKTLEISELFRQETYEALVREAQQDTVVWGDWEFKRARGSGNEPGFLMQRSFGDKASVHLKKYEEEPDADAPQTKPMEVGFEYRLRSKEALKLELKDDEQFVGIERKTRF